MRIAGIQLDDGRRVWADAGDCALAPLDRVLATLASGETQGWIFMTPEQLLGNLPTVEATVRAVDATVLHNWIAQVLPGADLPPLGTRTTVGDTTGMVTTIDPVNRLVTLTRDDGVCVVEPFG